MENNGWDGGNRRETKRRFDVDRRSSERKKRYWWGVVFPILIGIVGTAILTWGTYITHTTYGISAKYEESFVKHLENQATKSIKDDIRVDSIVLDYNTKILRLHDDMNQGFNELRKSNSTIYNLLLRHEEKRSERDQN